jgi:serine/threonine protein kinase
MALRLLLPHARAHARTQGTLREALDQRTLLPHGGFLPLKIALSLAHDVAAALLHLHNQGGAVAVFGHASVAGAGWSAALLRLKVPHTLTAVTHYPPALPRAGIVHGDLKAANVMLTRGGDDDDGAWLSTLGFKVKGEEVVCFLALAHKLCARTHAAAIDM